MDAAQHIVKLGPIAVELVDRTMLGLAREIAMFQPTIDAVVRGDPEAILFVEFAEHDQQENVRRLARLDELIGDLGLRWDQSGAKWGGVVEVLDPKLQAAITEMRTAGLNIMMSMKEEGKPVSFVEDCAVPLEHLADYTSRLTEIFAKHGTRGTWYAHASVGCLHVRPVLNLRLEQDVKAMRAIAEEAFAHGAGLQGLAFGRARRRHRALGIPREDVRRAARARLRRGQGLLRSQGPVQSRQNRTRAEIRRPPDVSAMGRTTAPGSLHTHLDWSAYPGAGGGFQGAVEMCNNNGACRALAGGVMCPSYRVTRDERDVTRGRANSLRLAITGQLGPDALDLGRDGADAEALRLLQGLPARMPDRRRHGAHEDRGAGGARGEARALAARPAGRISAALRAVGGANGPCSPTCATTGRGCGNGRRNMPALSARRSLPRWRADRLARARVAGAAPARRGGAAVVLFADTFNRYFEPENIEAALGVLAAAGYARASADAADGSSRPLCCGRTFLAVGLVEEARREAERCVAALAPFVGARNSASSGSSRAACSASATRFRR